MALHKEPVTREVWGTSLEGIVDQGDEVILGEPSNISAGDLIVYNFGGREVIKEVIGVPGNKIYIYSPDESYLILWEKSCYAFGDNTALKACWEDWVKPFNEIPESCYFVTGRKGSIGSFQKGYVHLSDIIGKVIEIRHK